MSISTTRTPSRSNPSTLTGAFGAYLEGRIVCRVEKRVETVIMTGRAVDNVEGRRWVVETIWIDGIYRQAKSLPSSLTVLHRHISLICMHMAVHDEVDIVLDQGRLKGLLAVEAYSG